MSADSFLERVLGDEGWQSGMSSDSVEAVVYALEALFPPEAMVTGERDAAIRAVLRRLGDQVRATPADEASLLAAALAALRT